MIKITKYTKNIIDNVEHLRFGKLKDIIKDAPIIPRNYSIYENKWVDDSHIRYIPSLKYALYELPLLKRRTPINEITVQNIPININTKPTQETIEYVIEHSILPGNDDINPVYYKNDNKSVAMFILIGCSIDTSDEDFANILKLFKDCGYYLATNDIAVDENTNTKYVISVIEPYWPDVDLIRFPEYVYHITPFYNKENIDINGFIPKSEAEFFDGPDRIYFFMSDDRKAMYNHIRHSRKLNNNSSENKYKAIIYKVKTTYDMRFYIDTRTFDINNNLIEDCIYSYDPISADNIESYEIVDLKTVPINIGY